MEIIVRLAEILNMIKEFKAGYSTKNSDKGYMLFEYKNKRYAVKLVEIENPSIDITHDINHLEYVI